MSQEQPVPVKIKRKRRKLSIYIDGSNGNVNAPREFFSNYGEVDGIMGLIYSELLRRSDGKRYKYVPDFSFGWFVPRKIKKGIIETKPRFDYVFSNIRDNPEYPENLCNYS